MCEPAPFLYPSMFQHLNWGFNTVKDCKGKSCAIYASEQKYSGCRIRSFVVGKAELQSASRNVC